MIEMKQTMAHFLLDESEPSFVFGHKKRVTAVTPPLLTLNYYEKHNAKVLLLFDNAILFIIL